MVCGVWGYGMREREKRSLPFFLRRQGSSYGFGALLKCLTSVVVLRMTLYNQSTHQQLLLVLRLKPTTFGLQV